QGLVQDEFLGGRVQEADGRSGWSAFRRQAYFCRPRVAALPGEWRRIQGIGLKYAVVDEARQVALFRRNGEAKEAVAFIIPLASHEGADRGTDLSPCRRVLRIGKIHENAI